MSRTIAQFLLKISSPRHGIGLRRQACTILRCQERDFSSDLRLRRTSESDPEKLPAKAVIPNIPSQKTHFYRRTLPHSCISFTSDEGKEVFRESLLVGDMNCYFQLASQYRTQDEPAFCGLSTLVMVLNTLEIDPKRIWKGPWRWYHENMLDCCIPLAVVEQTGITMDQFACLAACNMLNVKMIRTDTTVSENDFRNLVKGVVRRTDQVLVVTYSRACLGQTGDGHFSPIGGYSAERDMVLIMDTARFKYPPHWVSLSMLFKAMQQIDTTAGLSRGYFLLSKSDVSPGLIFRLSVNLSPVYLQNKDSKIAGFFQSWERLLTTQIAADVANSSTAVLNLAVSQLLSLLDVLDSDIFLLTAEVNHADSEEMSKQYGHDIRQLLSLIEKLPIFQIIDQGVRSGSISLSSLSKAGIPGRGSSNTDHSSSSVDQPCSRLSLNVASFVTPAHFLTMLVISWPYHRCSGGRLCTELHRCTSVLLSRPGSELLLNEASRLRQQLTFILSYCKSYCDNGGSCGQLPVQTTEFN